MISHLPAQQQLHCSINPQSITSIGDSERLPGLIGSEAHLDDAINCFFCSVLMRWAIKNMDLCRMLVEDGVGDCSWRTTSAVARAA